MSQMLFNGTHAEELRVAIADKGKLQDLLLEQPGREQKKANIYMGRITRIEPSLEAAFVDYGQERHGFLPLKEVAPCYYPNGKFDDNLGIKDVLKEGQELLIQVDKEERGNKGAALSTMISLAGSYLVLMPNNARAGGISRRIDTESRAELKEILSQLEIPEGMGLIVRTAGVGKSLENLQWDLNYLLTLWDAIQGACDKEAIPFLVYQESDIVFRALRDYLRPDIDEIIIDDEATYEKVKRHISWLHPDFVSHVTRYTKKVPLFVSYQIESQIDLVFQREIRLPSGGSIVIDRTEALVSIDINSAKSTKGGDIEETALNTNLEAAVEIARQLRLRDLGGLVVIDFIDMSPNRHQRAVEDKLQEALSKDRARIQIGRISRFGLLEMSRQRLRSSVGETTQEVCPRCHGRGTIRSIESLSMSVMRLIEEYATKHHTSQVNVQVPVEVGSYILNEKRTDISLFEERHDVVIFIMPNPHMETPSVEITSIKLTERRKLNTPSHQLIKPPEQADKPAALRRSINEPADTPAVKGIFPQQPAPKSSARGKAQSPSLISRFLKALFGGEKAEEAPQPEPSKQAPRRNNQQNRRGGNQQGRGQRNQRDGSNNNRSRQRNGSNNNDRRRNNNQQNRRGKQQDQQQTKAVVEETQETKQTRNDEAPRENNNRNRSRNQSSRTRSRSPQRRKGGQNREQKQTQVQDKAKTETTQAKAEPKKESAAKSASVAKGQGKPVSTAHRTNRSPKVEQPATTQAEAVVVKKKTPKTMKQYGESSNKEAIQQVETTTKAAPAQQATVKVPEGKKRPARQRKQHAQQEEKLVMVETKSDKE